MDTSIRTREQNTRGSDGSAQGDSENADKCRSDNKNQHPHDNEHEEPYGECEDDHDDANSHPYNRPHDNEL